MTRKVHPKLTAVESPESHIFPGDDHRRPPASASITLTVWRKSLLFNCSGFTVFDEKGNLVFRVDKYAKSGSNSDIVLMDATGEPLLTIRRKVREIAIWICETQARFEKLGISRSDHFSVPQKLSIVEHWQIYEGEASANPRLSVRKHVSFFRSKALAHVTPCSAFPADCGGAAGYEVEGSYAQRRCAIYDDSRRAMAEIRRKEAVSGVAFGHDVFRLVVQPGIHAAVAMAVVILLEEMFRSRRSLIKP
ncbi:Protein LURP-one-related 8 [Apostasia shenzhenica]|uniref:Protein LURP-one-related 8 n=1 Tax=Apostasia shenzhenica TaxID=1088818 RepID=A0A2I0B206_9ASPA|nr:Protein LURP-one-related 8 [Apostasia shenzhenica]